MNVLYLVFVSLACVACVMCLYNEHTCTGTEGDTKGQTLKSKTTDDFFPTAFGASSPITVDSGFDSQLGATGSRESERRAGSVLGTGNWERR